jgi:hypothetical protein
MDGQRECALQLMSHVYDAAGEAESASALCHNGLLDELCKLSATAVSVSVCDTNYRPAGDQHLFYRLAIRHDSVVNCKKLVLGVRCVRVRVHY